MPQMLELKNVTFRFRGLLAVNDVSFAVPAGSICSVIGPNGAGKSTMFNLITGYLKPERGQILFQGNPIGGMSTVKIAEGGIARAFQIARPFPDLAVVDNVRIGAMFGKAGARDVEAVTKQALELTGLTGLQDRKAGEITVGFLRRLELARAIATRPLLLLADEPCAGLNHAETDEIVDMLESVRRSGITVLLVEHDMNAVMKVSDTIFVLDAGTKIAEGTPDAIAQDDRVISAYLGKPV